MWVRGSGNMLNTLLYIVQWVMKLCSPCLKAQPVDNKPHIESSDTEQLGNVVSIHWWGRNYQREHGLRELSLTTVIKDCKWWSRHYKTPLARSLINQSVNQSMCTALLTRQAVLTSDLHTVSLKKFATISGTKATTKRRLNVGGLMPPTVNTRKLATDASSHLVASHRCFKPSMIFLWFWSMGCAKWSIRCRSFSGVSFQ